MMQPQTEFLQTLCNTVNEFGLPYACTVGPLPPKAGVSVELTAGHAESYLSRRECHQLILLFLCKHQNQKTAMDMAATIRNRLARLEEYPNGETFHWINLTPEEPEWVGEQGGHIYAVTAEALLYF